MDARVTRGRVAKRLSALLCVLTLGGAVLPAAAAEPEIAPADEPITPIPVAIDLDPAKVRLGERLFRDPRLSHDNRVACTSCHRLDEGGDDGQVWSIGADGRPLAFNAPTVFNAALSFRLNWRGNFGSLQEQAEAVLLEPRLMGTSWEELIPELDADPSYREAFEAAYGGPPARPHVLDALAAFERSLITPKHRSTATCAAKVTRSARTRSAAMRSSSPMVAAPVIRA